MEFQEKVVWITGSSKGIGASTAIAFAKEKASVVIHYVTEKEKAIQVQKEIEETYHVPTLLVQGDIAKEEDVLRMVEEVENHFGKIDILVNNAGISMDSRIEDKTVEEFQRVLDVNLLGTFLMCKYVGERMKKQKEGRIINISSNEGLDIGYPEGIDYNASKAGVIALTKSFAVEYAPNILVNAVAPGWVNTEMNRELDEEWKKKECDRILLKRFAEAEEIAGIVTFLASKKASYITAGVFRVDGGTR